MDPIIKAIPANVKLESKIRDLLLRPYLVSNNLGFVFLITQPNFDHLLDLTTPAILYHINLTISICVFNCHINQIE